MKNIKSLFLAILSLVVSSCELYMEEPVEPTLDEAKEHAVTKHTYHGDMTYQLKSDVHTMTSEDYLPYILAGEDTIMYLSESIPMELMPKTGEILYAERSYLFPNGLANKVLSVTRQAGMIKVVTSNNVVKIDEIFEELEIDFKNVPLGDPDFADGHIDETYYGEEETAAPAPQRTELNNWFNPDGARTTRADDDELYDDSTPANNSFTIFHLNSSITISLDGEALKKKWDGTELGAEMEVKSTATGDISFSLSKLMLRFDITHEMLKRLKVSYKGKAFAKKFLDKESPKFFIPLGSSPLQLEVSFKAEGGVELSGSVAYEYTKVTKSHIGFYADLKNGVFDKIETPEKEPDTTHKVEVEGRAMIWVKPTIKLGMTLCKGTVSAGISAAVYGEAGASVKLEWNDIGGEKFNFVGNPYADFIVKLQLGVYLEFGLSKSSPFFEPVMLSIQKIRQIQSAALDKVGGMPALGDKAAWESVNSEQQKLLEKEREAERAKRGDQLCVEAVFKEFELFHGIQYLYPFLNEKTFHVYTTTVTDDGNNYNAFATYSFDDDGIFDGNDPMLIVVDEDGNPIATAKGTKRDGSTVIGAIEENTPYEFRFTVPGDGRTFKAYPSYTIPTFGKVTQAGQKFAAEKGGMIAREISQSDYFVTQESDGAETDNGYDFGWGDVYDVYNYHYTCDFRFDGCDKVENWKFVLTLTKDGKQIYKKTHSINNPKKRRNVIAAFQMQTNVAPPIKVRIAPVGTQKGRDGNNFSVVTEAAEGTLVAGEDFYNFAEGDVTFDGSATMQTVP